MKFLPRLDDWVKWLCLVSINSNIYSKHLLVFFCVCWLSFLLFFSELHCFVDWSLRIQQSLKKFTKTIVSQQAVEIDQFLFYTNLRIYLVLLLLLNKNISKIHWCLITLFSLASTHCVSVYSLLLLLFTFCIL